MGMGTAKVVLRHFGPPWGEPGVALNPVSVGHSGGEIWKVAAAGMSGALRRYPVGFEVARVRWVHEALRQARTSCPLVPVIHSAGIGSFVTVEESVWELATWMPGAPASAHHPTPKQIACGVEAITRWHSVPFALAKMESRFIDVAQSDGIQRRLNEWERLMPILTSRTSFANRPWALLAQRTRELAFAGTDWFAVLHTVSIPSRRRTICLRDVHREHILFTEDEVTGLIDFGALGWDLPVGDLARFVGSFHPRGVNAIDGWNRAWSNLPAQYGDAAMGRLLAQTLTMVAALHWFEWFSRGDTFRDPAAAERRWSEVLDHLDYWINGG